MYECIEHAAETIFNSQITIFITLLRWNVILYIFDNLHVVSSLLDQCSKNEHMQNVLMHM